MVKLPDVKVMALSFESAEEFPHFEIISIRVKKKIFVTINAAENRACLKLSLIDQDVFSTTNPGIIYPVPNAWGKYGWTLVNLKKIKKTIFKDALNCAYCNVAPKILSIKYQVQ